MLNFALCDDNESILARLSKMLESLFIKYNFDCKVTFTSVDPNSFLAYVINNPVDVIFLDIDLKSNINGLSLAETIRKYNKNIYQIVLRWHIQNGIIPIPYSFNPKHNKSNLDVFDFELTDDEMKVIDGFNYNSRLRYDPDNCDFSIL